MIIQIACGALHGVDAFTVMVEVDYARAGLPAFAMVGLAEGAVREARDRVLAALRNSNYKLPPARVTVNFSPADRRKDGSSYDLPLAVGLMAAAGLLPEAAVERLSGLYLCGELSLNGELKPVPGVLPLAILARNEEARGLIVPADNADEAAMVEGLPLHPARSLGEVIAFLTGDLDLAFVATDQEERREEADPFLPDFVDIKGQEHAKRAVEIAAAGGHNLLFIGPPGSGKTMLSRSIPSILPPMDFEEALEVTKIYSVAGRLQADRSLIRTRPFRSPHHTISENGLIGGGAFPKPGEISLAHRGVLFLDELPEFRKQTLEVLRQPLEQGSVTVARAAQSVSYPADVMLVAAMNPCPCGFHTHRQKACTCSNAEIQRYRAKLSGPLLDRIDLHIEVPAVPYEDLQAGRAGKSSAQMRANIAAARSRQTARYAETPFRCNADLSGRMLEEYCDPGRDGHAFLKEAVTALHLSARAYTRILRIARTVADLEDTPRLTVAHLAEAVNCRVLDRGAV